MISMMRGLSHTVRVSVTLPYRYRIRIQVLLSLAAFVSDELGGVGDRRGHLLVLSVLVHLARDLQYST